MFDTIRLAGMIVILLTVVLLAALQHPEWARDLDLEEKTWTDLMGISGDAGEVPARRYPGEKFFVERNAKKVQATEGVIAGRLTLFEAASVFRCLNEEYPTVPVDPLSAGCSEDERFCVDVLYWVRISLERDSDAANKICARLEEQLRQHKERHGRVILPEVAAAEN